MARNTQTQTWARLYDYGKHLRWTVLSLGVIAAGAALLVFTSESTGDFELQVATVAAILGTYAALIVALLVFEWTADAKTESDGYVLDLINRIDSNGEGVSAVATVDAEDRNEDNLAAPPGGTEIEIAGQLYYFVTQPGRHDLNWWRRVLDRIGSVAEDDQHVDQESARTLLGTDLKNVTAVGFLAKEQAGNRRTLLLVEAPGSEPQLWSVFKGKGAHVRLEKTIQII